MLAKLTVRRRAQKRAQGMTEYIIIVGLVAILLVGAVTKFKDALGGAFDAASGEIDSKITSQIGGGAGGAGGGSS